MKIVNKIYLDFNATSPILREVRDFVVPFYDSALNASSIHSFGRDARKILDDARADIAKSIGAEGADIIFTSSGTESNNLALKGFKDADYLVISAVEHPSVLKVADKMEATILPVDKNGVVNLKALEKILKNTKGKALVSVMLANNETGVVQPIKEISQLVLFYKGFIHCDAVQAFGKIPVDFSDLNVDMMTISAHKIGGLQGASALIVKKGLNINSQIIGGGQESGARAGTENVAAIAAFAKAAKLVEPQNSALIDYLEAEVKSFAKDAIIVGEEVERLPNTSCIILQGMLAETQLINFDLAGIAVSSGSACTSGKVGKSHVLLAQGYSAKQASEVVRVSIGKETTKQDIDAFLKVWKSNYEKASNTSKAA